MTTHTQMGGKHCVRKAVCVRALCWWRKRRENVLFNGIYLIAARVNIGPTNEIRYLGNERRKHGLSVRVHVCDAGDVT